MTINYLTRHGFAGFVDGGGCAPPIDYSPDGLGDVPADGTNFNSAIQTDGHIRLFTPSADDDIPPGGLFRSRFIFVKTTATQYGEGCGVIHGPTSSVVIPAYEPR